MNERDRKVSQAVFSGARGYLLSLLYPWRLSGREWAVVITVWLSPSPIPARQVAKLLHQPYSHTKAVVRGLVKLNILTRTPDGLVIQRDAQQWGLPATPMRPRPSLDRPPKKDLGSTEDREVVFE